jgi:hypothetical protein
LNPDQAGSLFLGNLIQRFVLDNSGKFIDQHPSGAPLFAAAAAKSLAVPSAIQDRIGSNFPAAQINQIETMGIDTSLVHQLNEPLDQRLFTSLANPAHPRYDQPVHHFAALNQPLPKALLDYQYVGHRIDSKKERTSLTWREADLEGISKNIGAAHLCPADFLSHELIPSALRQLEIEIITLEAPASYMIPDFKRAIPELVTGLKAFITSRNRILAMYGERADLGEIMENIASYGCDSVIAVDQFTGIDLYVASSAQHIHIPAYPSKLRDLTFARSSFAGGLLASLIGSHDLIESALYATATMSVATESHDPFFILDTYQGLITSRKENLALAMKTL